MHLKNIIIQDFANPFEGTKRVLHIYYKKKELQDSSFLFEAFRIQLKQQKPKAKEGEEQQPDNAREQTASVDKAMVVDAFLAKFLAS